MLSCLGQPPTSNTLSWNWGQTRLPAARCGAVPGQCLEAASLPVHLGAWLCGSSAVLLPDNSLVVRMSGALKGPAVLQNPCRGVSGLLSSSDLGLIFSFALVPALTYVQTGHRCNAPFTPKVLLCGPLGSGKSLQAALLAQRYSLVDSEYLTGSVATCLLPAPASCVPGCWEQTVTILPPVLAY